jgi:hypothetical protein
MMFWVTPRADFKQKMTEMQQPICHTSGEPKMQHVGNQQVNNIAYLPGAPGFTENPLTVSALNEHADECV